ncbi:chloride channel voltage gated [Actinomyces glycerinitolerans]|uniref:Chloride channel voltage gated n=1 Tax=Actinomyces glycerinitolerans TaxID=1892869 RepID=A0A1M4S196_9ACTO|nr:chloride channel voltage gated [Actinomyces glycerinitolerans]
MTALVPRNAGGRLREHALNLLRYHRTGLFILAVLTGLTAGAGAVVFRAGIDLWTRVLTGTDDYTLILGPSTGVLAGLGRGFVLAAPVLSGLLVGVLMSRLGATATGHGVAGVIWSARRSDGTMAPLPAGASVLAATLTIGGGGSVGPEGPIAELGASTASVFGRRLGLPRRSVRLLAAAGTAAGIAAAFNAPLAGAFFALEVVLMDFTVDAFAFVVLACVAATVLAHHLLGTTLSVSLPALDLHGDAQLLWVALLGLVGGVVGVLFSRCRYLAADLLGAVGDRLHLPAWVRPAVGGLLVGALLLAVPEVYGESAAVLDRALGGQYTAAALLGLTAAKILATSVTLGVGMTGGVFAPSLCIGATLGAAWGTALAPNRPEAAAVFGVIGMGAVFAGSARAPITGTVLIIEMTGQYHLLLPLMLAVALSTTMSRFLTRTTIYTEELRRRGDDIDDPVRATLVGRVDARGLMHAPPAVLEATASLAEAAEALRAAGAVRLPVVGDTAAGKPESGAGAPKPVWLGCVSAVAVAEARSHPDAGEASGSPRCVGGLPLDREHVDGGADAHRVLGALIESHLEALPVTQALPDGGLELIGWVSQEDMVRRLYRQQRRAVEAAEQRTSLGSRTQAWLRRRRTR